MAGRPAEPRVSVIRRWPTNETTDPNDSWNPDDLVFDFPDVTYSGPLVGLPLPGKVWKVNSYVMAILKQGVVCLSAGAEIPPLLTGLATVDYLAGFWAGKRTTADDYVGFMRAYFPSRYTPYLREIYTDLRCGLLHNLVATNPWGDEPVHFRIVGACNAHLDDEGGRIVFCVLSFLEEVRRAWFRYAHALLSGSCTDNELPARFERRFARLCGTGAFMEESPELP